MYWNIDRIVMTRGINEEMSNDENFEKEVLKAFSRYLKKDWGEMCEEDKQMNDEAVSSGNNRILASYETSKGNIYIITEHDGSATTILFANEYWTYRS